MYATGTTTKMATSTTIATMSVRFRPPAACVGPGVGVVVEVVAAMGVGDTGCGIWVLIRTSTGESVEDTLLLPICPSAFEPQAHTVPSLFNARVWYAPAAMAVTPFRPGTWVGVVTSFPPTFPRPSCPSPL